MRATPRGAAFGWATDGCGLESDWRCCGLRCTPVRCCSRYCCRPARPLAHPRTPSPPSHHTARSIAATNVFEKQDGKWKLVHHHGSPAAKVGVAL